ncbi:hypothetical protein [Fischerella sp. PCC 9605]|uniref:hypothetical protein n=1 Tax=Fischerella sp. PCC 9605 TaxID=1173024 RepID=UPI00047D0516|nr:hypothetical protein [Fischerella sp. PCC 9605]
MRTLKALIKQPLMLLLDKPPPKLLNNSLIGVPEKCNQWSIGIYIGKSLFDLYSPDQQKNPFLTRRDVSDVRAGFVADPFMLNRARNLFARMIKCDHLMVFTNRKYSSKLYKIRTLTATFLNLKNHFRISLPTNCIKNNDG